MSMPEVGSTSHVSAHTGLWRSNRWLITRAGSATGGYGLGWFVQDCNDIGAFFTTWDAALAFAMGQAYPVRQELFA
ncbi:hypothetical protein ALI44B_04630 [Leifsonia sp. ALI-44-B]|uniref:hypothetical protein n=1 Tax=Leifsonia sp. ALI-44-B TaxID=1933776 RepID=UPI00097C2495|nr:hypothetical protein [Leifsonia sp. ALI-44-B]ONI63916.1 hypothetical protein ALI44B_04630 [Leifsonia sp. ALI-44-B]